MPAQGQATFARKQQQLQRAVGNAMTRLHNKLHALNQQQAATEKAEATRKQADLLTANLYRASQGDSQLEVCASETCEMAGRLSNLLTCFSAGHRSWWTCLGHLWSVPGTVLTVSVCAGGGLGDRRDGGHPARPLEGTRGNSKGSVQGGAQAGSHRQCHLPHHPGMCSPCHAPCLLHAVSDAFPCNRL